MFLLRRYSELLIEHPVKTKSVTAGVITALGDGLTQHIMISNQNKKADTESPNAKHEHHSMVRSLKMFAYGTIFIGPILHNWFRILDHVMPMTPENTATQFKRFGTVIKRVVVEASTYSPFIISTFFVVNTATDYYTPDKRTPDHVLLHRKEGSSLFDVIRFKFERDFLETYGVSLRLWPLVQTFNFYRRFVI